MNIGEILLLAFLFFPSVSFTDKKGVVRFSIKGFILASLDWLL